MLRSFSLPPDRLRDLVCPMLRVQRMSDGAWSAIDRVERFAIDHGIRLQGCWLMLHNVGQHPLDPGKSHVPVKMWLEDMLDAIDGRWSPGVVSFDDMHDRGRRRRELVCGNLHWATTCLRIRGIRVGAYGHHRRLGGFGDHGEPVLYGGGRMTISERFRLRKAAASYPRIIPWHRMVGVMNATGRRQTIRAFTLRLEAGARAEATDGLLFDYGATTDDWKAAEPVLRRFA